MTGVFKIERGLVKVVTLLTALGLGIAGCSDDGGGFLEMPGGGSGGSQLFTRSLASEQAIGFVETAVSMIEMMPAYAEGFEAKQQGDMGFDWNQTHQQWEFYLTLSDEGFYIDTDIAIQFQNSQGQPQREAEGADRLLYSESTTFEVDANEGDTHLVTNLYGSVDLTMSGLQSDVRNLQGSSSMDLEYDYQAPGRSEYIDTTLSWETLTGGVDIPVVGCPSGTIRYTLPPYRLDIVFDGDDMATYTLYDSQDNPVPEGSGTEMLFCGAKMPVDRLGLIRR